MADGGWRVEDGGWRMEGGGCLMADGGWRMEDELWIKDGWIKDDAYYKGFATSLKWQLLIGSLPNMVVVPRLIW